MQSNQLADAICAFLSDKKAQDIIKINISDKTTIADYFVIASARSQLQVKALCENLEEFIEKSGGEIKNIEGAREGRWAVIDAVDVVIHIFNDEQRLFYHLERLWGEGEKYTD